MDLCKFLVWICNDDNWVCWSAWTLRTVSSSSFVVTVPFLFVLGSLWNFGWFLFNFLGPCWLKAIEELLSHKNRWKWIASSFFFLIKFCGFQWSFVVFWEKEVAKLDSASLCVCFSSSSLSFLYIFSENFQLLL